MTIKTGTKMGAAELSRQPVTPDAADIMAVGREVITAEAASLQVLAGALGQTFADAVATILALRGRVIMTGIGKSGHIARKVAATLASTGTPSIYVHPAEAAHGDLGMLMAGDGLMVLSNSGQTAELQPILAHACRLNLPVIGVAGREDCLVMRHADVKLVLPAVDEACPANLAPTTSTAMMMALGDALAMTAMRARGVSRAGFEELHPGGTIGRRLMRVAAIMHRGTSMPLVAADTLMRDVIVTMTARSFGIAGVVDADGALIGVITDGDLRRHLDGLMDTIAADVMTCDPVWVAPGCLVEDALEILNQHKITAMFAVEDPHARYPVGLVHVHDFLRLGLA
ncbi:KpsF/GutQ family sugar-phosphate isomerase [uncultured Sphingomonas sp.]|uniref:KpsF/GutQ family sugar-phosphate isomerase n=1 Tax=uncultured Sphingomonas sp. TaxID=158754 RepID=UPI0025E2D442|nr:KpsF/GutQ family sugar-phosphate isomerase [uncultured Sphingomonas sp.]